MITLYDYELSGNCYKVRLFLALLGVPYSRHAIDFYPGREHKSPWFLELNPAGQLPVLKDGDAVICDSKIILSHLASRYDATGQWYPRMTLDGLDAVASWLAFADKITDSAAAARLHDGMFYDCDIEQCRRDARRLFQILDEHLWFAQRSASGWLCDYPHPTIADIAVFPYVQLSEEGGIPRRDFPSIRRWLDRVKKLPGFITMPGIFPSPSHP